MLVLYCCVRTQHKLSGLKQNKCSPFYGSVAWTLLCWSPLTGLRLPWPSNFHWVLLLAATAYFLHRTYHCLEVVTSSLVNFCVSPTHRTKVPWGQDCGTDGQAESANCEWKWLLTSLGQTVKSQGTSPVPIFPCHHHCLSLLQGAQPYWKASMSKNGLLLCYGELSVVPESTIP